MEQRAYVEVTIGGTTTEGVKETLKYIRGLPGVTACDMIADRFACMVVVTADTGPALLGRIGDIRQAPWVMMIKPTYTVPQVVIDEPLEPGVTGI